MKLHGSALRPTIFIHTARILSLYRDLPLVVIIVDAGEKIRAFAAARRADRRRSGDSR